MTEQKCAILAAGGTGGHMFPAQSIAENLAARGWTIVLTTDERGMRYAGGFDENIERLVLPTASFSQGSITKRLTAPVQIFKGYRSARKLFKRIRPSAVIGFGGYPSLPSLMAARRKSVPYFIHEQNAVLGRVNRRFQSKARKVACGLWPVKYASDNAIFIGNPVREQVLEFEASPLPQGNQIRILIFGGSQGATALSKIVPYAISLLPNDLRQKIHVTQQAREAEVPQVEKAYAQADVQCEVAPFFTDLPKRIADSHFVIARSGASTLAELQTIGRGSILVPLPTAANDHQRANAQALVSAGAAVGYDELRNQPEELAVWLQDILGDQARLERMADSAYRLARPKAAEALAELVENEI